MIRPLCVISFALTLVGALRQSGAQQSIVTPSSTVLLGEAEQLHEQAGKLYDEGKFREGTPVAERALALSEQALGPTHANVAVSLNDLARLYKAQGAYGKAEPLYVRAVEIFEKALGPTHPNVATSLHNLAALYLVQGAYGKAAPLLVRALAIDEHALGPTHPDVAVCLSGLASLYEAQGAYDKAEPLFVRALAINEQTLGPAHPYVATSLNDLASLYEAQGAYAKAEPLFVRALAIDELALEPGHPLIATTLNNLARLYQDEGAYTKAEPLFVRALGISEQARGPNHPNVATTLNNLALLYYDQGAFGKAEPLFIRALAIREQALGPAHHYVATTLNNLATLYRAQGAYHKAGPLFVRALAIFEKALGSTHLEVAKCLDNLAGLYLAQGAYDVAEPLYVRALTIFEQALGPTHPDVATSLNNLALLYWEKRAYGKAEPLFVRALAISEKALGPANCFVAKGLGNLALLYKEQGAYGKAEPLFVRALAISEQALGPTHPDVAQSLSNLFGLYLAQGAYGRAEPLATRAAEIREQQLRTELAQLSEPRKRALMSLLQGETYALVSLHADAMPTSTQALELAFTTVLRRKGRILDSLVDNETALRAHSTPSILAQLDELSAARTELSARLYAPLRVTGAMDRKAIQTARVRIEELESALSAASAEFRVQSEPVTLAKLQSVLPARAALVEFVRYSRFDARQTQPWQEDRYVAYVLTTNGPPHWVALGAAAPIDSQVDAVRTAMNPKVKMSNEATTTALRRLDALVFAPVRAQLAGVSHVIFAPEAKLNLVPFEALVDADGRYALERYLVGYVTTGRDLLRFPLPHAARSAPVIIAGPDYGPVPTERKPGAMSFAPLAGARAEATDLQKYFSTTPLIGDKATKMALAGLTGPALLHVATHGFYARDPTTSPSVLTPSSPASSTGRPAPDPQARATTLPPRQLARGMLVDGSAPPLLPPPRSDDPAEGLDRAGLAMAGANQGAAGIVTARELAGFDWWGTQLVVLSACEKGIGAAPSGEGVYGMHRALVLAGAASQVVSLWNVNDSSARDLMRDYYAELARGTGRAEALRQAKLRLLHQPRYAHPYYWAPFIPAGDWRPLDKTVFATRKPQP